MKNSILITGGCRGLGLAIAKQFLSNDWTVHVTSRTKSGLPSHLALANCGTSNKLFHHFADFSSPQGCMDFIDRFHQKVPEGVEVLINNAGFFLYSDTEDTSFDTLHDAFAINFFAPFILTKELGRKMLEHGRGHIINMGSSSAYSPSAKTSVYAASKGALRAFSIAVSREWRCRGVDSTFIAPGSIQTAMGQKIVDQNFQTFINPDQLAEVVYGTVIKRSSLIIEELGIGRRSYE